jgi:Tfp pilus assembly protein PilP
MNRAILVIACAGLVAPVLAQERLPLGTHVGSGTGVSSTGSSQPPTYNEGGRRDPFVTLMIAKKSGAAATAARPIVGLAGVALADVAVKGVIHNGATMVAVLEGPGGKSFVARSKDRLQDATVKAIDADGVVFIERVVDALGAVRTRDVRKSLRLNAEGDR